MMIEYIFEWQLLKITLNVNKLAFDLIIYSTETNLMFIMDSLSETSTHDSSFESQTQVYLRDNIQNSIALMQGVIIIPMLEFGMKQIMHHYFSRESLEIQKIIQQAQKYLLNRMYDKCEQTSRIAFQRAKQAGKSMQIQAASLILIQCLISIQKVAEAEVLLSELDTINLPRTKICHLNILTLSIRLVTLNDNELKVLTYLEQLKSMYIDNQYGQMHEKVKFINLYAKNLLQINRWELAEKTLREWMSVLVNEVKVSNTQIAQFYLLLAKCARLSGNLDHQYSHLCCAWSSILIKSNDTNLKAEICIQKINNLIDRNLLNKAIDEFTNITNLAPKKTLAQNAYLSKYKAIIAKLKSKVKQNVFHNQLKIGKDQKIIENEC